MPGPVLTEDPLLGLALGHYRVTEKIGSGGMGVVYRAHDEHLDREVAIKVLLPGTLADEPARKHFRKEALALSKLNHPNIATIFDFDTQEGVDFLAMEYIPGVSLSERLATGPLEEKQVIALGTQLAEGLATAHEHAVIHRDLKPGNLRLFADGRLKILDFGLAKLRQPSTESVATESMTESRGITGTLPYMAPEQLLGGAIDARTDIHAAGLVLYEMATGRRPFEGAEHLQLVGAILHKPPPPPSTLNPGLSPELGRIIGKCLEKEPCERYQSARELAIDLRRLQAGATGEPPLAKRPARRANLFRHGLVAAGLIVFVVAAGFVAWIVLRQPASVAGRRQATVAVLPFQNAGAGAEADFLRLSLPDEITTTLSYAPALNLRPFASTRRYASGEFDLQAAGNELRVQHVVTGHFASEPGGMRVTLEMVEVEGNRVLWHDSVVVPAQDWIALREKVGAMVRSGLVPALGLNAIDRSASRPANPEAYELYLRSLAVSRDAAPNLKAMAMLERAVQLDPAFAPAWAELSGRYYNDGNFGTGGTARYEQAETAARHATELDPNLTDAAEWLIVLQTERGDLNGAYDQAIRLLKQRPDRSRSHFHLSYVLRYAGLAKEAAPECDAALALDPVDRRLRSCFETFVRLGRYDRAEDFLRLDQGSDFARFNGARVLVYRGKYAEALDLLRQSALARTGELGFLQAFLEHRPEAELDALALQVERHMEGYRDPEWKYDETAHLSFAGRPEPALRLLRRAVEQSYCSYPVMDHDPLFAALRKLPEYPAVRAEGMACQQRFLAHRAQLTP